MENARSSYRVETALPVIIRPMGRGCAATVLNLSAGGALLETDAALLSGTFVNAELQLGGTTVQVTFEVLEPMSTGVYRCRTTAPEGSESYEALAHLVRSIETKRLGHRSGASESSRMVRDPQRQQARRPEHRERFARPLGAPDA